MKGGIIKLLSIFILTISVLGSSRFYFKDGRFSAQVTSFLEGEEEQYVERSLQTLPEEPPKPSSVRVPIILYHSVRPYYPGESRYQDEFDVTPEDLDRQIKYLLNDGYTIISFNDLINYFNNDEPLPAKAAVLTFDDGWENQFVYAMPVLRKNNVTGTFFVYTDAIGKNHFMNWNQVKELDNLGMSIGSHTRTHPYLFRITDESKLRSEIIDSKKILEEKLGKSVDVFAAPFGYSNAAIVRLVKEAGYKAARTTYKGIYHTKEDLFELKAIEASDGLNQFIKEISK